MALNRIDPRNEKSLHVSFDIDSLDPLEAPSTGTPGRADVFQYQHLFPSPILVCTETRVISGVPVRGGLSLREGIHLMEEIHRTNRLNAIDLVEVNPRIGNDTDVDLTVGAAVHIIQAALGYTRRGLKVPDGVTDIPLQTFR